MFNLKNQDIPEPPAGPGAFTSSGIHSGIARAGEMDFESVHRSGGPQKLTSVRLKEPVGKVFVVFAVLTLITAIAGGGLFYYKNYLLTNELKQLTKKKDSLLAEYNNTEIQATVKYSQKILTKIKDYNTIFNQRNDWNKILSIIASESLRKVTYTDLAISEEAILSLSGKTPDYETLAKALRSWENSEWVEKVTLDSYGAEETSEEDENPAIQFSMTINLKEGLVKVNKEEQKNSTVTTGVTGSTPSPTQ